MRCNVSLGGSTHCLGLTKEELAKGEDAPPRGAGASLWKCQVNGREILVNAIRIAPDTLSLLIGGQSFEVKRQLAGGQQQIVVRGVCYDISVDDPRSLRSRKRSGMDDAGPLALVASMPGKVVRILASEGDRIEVGQGIIVVEAMKMQNEIHSPKAGALTKLLAREGGNVNAGDVLAIVE